MFKNMNTERASYFTERSYTTSEAENKKDQTLEDVFEQLDEVVKKLEGEAVSLEDSFQLYHEGMELLKICNDKIETIEKKVMILDKDGEEHEF